MAGSTTPRARSSSTRTTRARAVSNSRIGGFRSARPQAENRVIMITPRHILWGILLPALIALIATLLGQLGVRRERKTQPWGPALAIAGGFALAYVGIVGAAPSFP